MSYPTMKGQESVELVTKRKNTDYTNSAVNLTNSVSIMHDLVVLSAYKQELDDIQFRMDSFIPNELKTELANTQKNIAQLENSIKASIEVLGSCQDLEKGWYAVKQRKVSKSYNPSAFERNYPEFASAVIVKAVDTVKLNGLIKGGLLNEDNLKNPDVGVITETESYSYIIKV